MTQPAPASALDTDEQASGRAADAIADMHDELRRRYSGLNSAEVQLAEALLAAHATTATGRAHLQSIQRQLVEAIVNPAHALDTPAGERQFLLFLRSKVAEIQRIVDDGALTARDQAALTRALAGGYLGDDQPSALPLESPADDSLPPARSSASAPSSPASAVPPPQATAAPPMGMPAMPASAGGLPPAAASPLAGLGSLLSGDDGPIDGEHDTKTPKRDADDNDEPDDDRGDDEPSASPDGAAPEDAGPAETRPAAS